MNKRAGYSLFEVLIAFAVMAMVLVVLVPGQAKLLARASDTDDRALAFDLALSHMARLGISEPLAFGGTTSQHGRWEALIAVVPSGDGLADITVQVRGRNGNLLAQATTTRVMP